MNEPLVSIVIPIYNVEKYLKHCLDSVCCQTYKNIEVILVNDGSPDKSGQIAKQYAETDHRFRYFEKENGGLSSARNYGIDICSGEYISFIDSDDWVEPDFIQLMIESIQETGSDISVCNMKYIFNDGTERRNVPKILTTNCVSNIEALSDLLSNRYFRCHAQNKIYKSELFIKTGIRYPVGKLYEDVFTTYKLFFNAKMVSYVSKDLYFYLQKREGSILNSGFSNKQLDLFEAYDEIKCFIAQEGIDGKLSNDFSQLAISGTLAMVNFIYPIYFQMMPEERKEIRQIIKGTRNRYSIRDYLKNANLTWSQRLRYFGVLNAFSIYCLCMKVIRK